MRSGFRGQEFTLARARAGGMKILLDESGPQKLRLLIQRHAVVTVWFQGWSGLKNGALLRAAEEEDFDLFITADQEIGYQQNLTNLKLAVLVLSTNNWDHMKTAAAQITAAIDAIEPGSYNELRIPE